MKKRTSLALIVLGTVALVYAGIARPAQKPATVAAPVECCDPNSPEMCGDAITTAPGSTTPKKAAAQSSTKPPAAAKRPAPLL